MKIGERFINLFLHVYQPNLNFSKKQMKKMKKTLLTLLGLATGIAIASEAIPTKLTDDPITSPGIERRLSDMGLFQLLNQISPMDYSGLHPSDSVQAVLEVETKKTYILDEHYRISGRFGEPRPKTQGGSGTREHQGVDVATPLGTPIYNPWEGIVIFAGWKKGYGRTVDILHPEKGLTTRYAHLSKWLAFEGDTVIAGQNIALTGNSGKKPNGDSYSPHAHIEVRKNDVPVNPLKYDIIP